ncbi:fibronectin type III-like domain-contianing protein [Limosilactobacillus fermentum]|uniref:fibronectin type III-like domain-contianing protein n=1 Tax=Limosilactobacillus fermentum TaxID=1613 RepID=UPI00384D3300
MTGDSTETPITVSVDITNIGDRAGKEVVQLYIHRPELDRLQPLKELRQFEKVLLQPGETKTVSFTLSNEELASYDVYNHAWNPISGDYQVMIGSSSQDIQYSADLHYTNHHLLPKHYDLNTTFKELLADEKAHDWILGLMKDLNRAPWVMTKTAILKLPVKPLMIKWSKQCSVTCRLGNWSSQVILPKKVLSSS